MTWLWGYVGSILSVLRVTNSTPKASQRSHKYQRLDLGLEYARYIL